MRVLCGTDFSAVACDAAALAARWSARAGADLHLIHVCSCHEPVALPQELNAGLLVVGNHQWHGFQRWWRGSVSHGVLNAATIAVAVVPSLAGSDAPHARVPGRDRYHRPIGRRAGSL